jgi:hypothetical protein
VQVRAAALALAAIGLAGCGSAPRIHDGAIAEVSAWPSRQMLSRTKVNTIVVSTKLGFAVTVQNKGDFRESNVKVFLRVRQPVVPVTRTAIVRSIDPGETKIVVFRNLGQAQFATLVAVVVGLAPAPRERELSNNSARYPVVFSLG